MIYYIYADLEIAEQLGRQVTGLRMWVSACALSSAGIQEFLHQPLAEMGSTSWRTY